ncbi:RNA polymerase sigma factor [Ktedonosporobacter rubrisoli]|nr:RNA polymerase sigma factor [Ktedonosporobacter rubrisoli]
MFYSVTIPGILQARPVETFLVSSHPSEEVSASMPVEKPIKKSRGGNTTTADEVTLSRIYEQFKRPIHTYIYRLLGNQEDADDLTQEVFVRACTAWNGLYERDRLSSWLYRIASNLCIDALRRRKRISWWPLAPRTRNDEQDAMAAEDAAYFLSDSGGIPEIAERELIRLTLANMPEEYAVTLVLSAAQGVPYQEIAEIVGISPNAAATRISRAKKMFAEQYQRLSKEGVGKRGKQT